MHNNCYDFIIRHDFPTAVMSRLLNSEGWNIQTYEYISFSQWFEWVCIYVHIYFYFYLLFYSNLNCYKLRLYTSLFVTIRQRKFTQLFVFVVSISLRIFPRTTYLLSRSTSQYMCVKQFMHFYAIINEVTAKA